MAENKRHHFVPQLYLRYFSHDEKTISVFSVNRNKIVSQKAPIDRQCYKNYLYSKEPMFEKLMSKIEGDYKEIIETVISKKLIPKRTKFQYNTLITYILFQSARTLFAANQTNDLVDKMAKSHLRDYIKLNNIKDVSIEDVENVTISLNESALQNLSNIARLVPIMFDLGCKLIINNTNFEFITSDNPVVLFNKYYLNSQKHLTGFASKGLIIFFPISPKYYLIYFDSVMYKVGGRKLRSVINIDKNQDVYELNKLQTINANRTIYTRNVHEEYLQLSLKSIEQYRPDDLSKLIEGNFRENSDKTQSKTLIFKTPKIKYDANLSFLRINPIIPDTYLMQGNYRNPLLVELNSEFYNRVEKGDLDVDDWEKFLTEKNISY